jgi:putative transposase
MSSLFRDSAMHANPGVHMRETDLFELHGFDPSADLFVTTRNLPHWFQAGAAIFITFRTYDSLPKSALVQMRVEFEDWLARQSLPSAIAKIQFELRSEERRLLLSAYPKMIQWQVTRRFDALFNRALDDCHGECLVGIPENAKIVSDAILFYEGTRYLLDCFVVMPNHVHAIVQFMEGFDLQLVGQSWMRYSARKINQRMGRKGVLWQPEPFDHIIRSGEQLSHLRRYIALNPQVARLTEDQFVYWKRQNP